MDVDDKLRFLSLHGVLKIDEVLGVYKDADFRIVYIDAEKTYITELYLTWLMVITQC